MKIKVPDFSEWDLKKTDYVYYDTAKEDFFIDNEYVDLEPQSVFIGCMKDFTTKDGLGMGRSVIFYNQGEVIKFWGMKGEGWSFWAMQEDEKWRIFSFKDYYNLVCSLHPVGDNKRIAGVRLVAVKRDTEKEFFGINIFSPRTKK